MVSLSTLGSFFGGREVGQSSPGVSVFGSSVSDGCRARYECRCVTRSEIRGDAVSSVIVFDRCIPLICNTIRDLVHLKNVVIGGALRGETPLATERGR